jgi:hypothetical protein
LFPQPKLIRRRRLAHDISVVTPVGYGLDEEAVKAVKKWRFKPGKGSGKPARVQIRIEAAIVDVKSRVYTQYKKAPTLR